jgi:hypothetical protein
MYGPAVRCKREFQEQRFVKSPRSRGVCIWYAKAEVIPMPAHAASQATLRGNWRSMRQGHFVIAPHRLPAWSPQIVVHDLAEAEGKVGKDVDASRRRAPALVSRALWVLLVLNSFVLFATVALEIEP